MKCTKLVSKPSTDFWGSLKCTQFVMDEMYEIGQFLEFEYEYCRIYLSCKSINVVLLAKSTLMSLFGCSCCACVFSCLVCMKVLMLSFIKLGCIRYCCGMKENILTFALSPLCLVYIKLPMPSVTKLSCKRCID